MRSSGTRPKCDTGKGPVTVDWILAGAAGLGALIALESDAVGPGLAVGVAAGAFAASALRGNNAVNECREAIAAYEGRGGPELLAVDDDDDDEDDVQAPAPRIIVGPATPADPYAQPHAATVAPATAPTTAPSTAPSTTPATPSAVPPAPAQVPVKQTKAPRPPKPAPADADDWRDFWQEVR